MRPISRIRSIHNDLQDDGRAVRGMPFAAGRTVDGIPNLEERCASLR